MEDADIYPKLTDVFRDILNDDTLVLKPEMTADDVPGWDSMTHIQLILATERAFKVKFSASQVALLKQVGDLVRLIRSRL